MSPATTHELDDAMTVAVFTVDQRGSRTGPDLVPAMISRLSLCPALLAFERTAGDEIQGVAAGAEGVAAITEQVLRVGTWNVGIGIGEIDAPLPDHARAGRGTAYLRARDAVTAAKSAPWHLRVSGPDHGASRQLESALWLWASVLRRRSDKGWEVADLLETGLTHEDAATKLGITQSAVTQRAHAAGVAEGRRARELAEFLAAQCLGPAAA